MIPLLGTDPKELETGTQVQVHIGSQQHFPQQLKVQMHAPTSRGRINNTWFIYTVEYYLAIKRNEALIRATTWMNLENMMLRKEARHKRTNIVHEILRRGKFIETESRLEVTRGWGRWEVVT